MQYLDLEPFEQFVRERDLVPESKISFYTHWVLRLLRSEFASQELENRDLLQAFSDQLARDDALADWERGQDAYLVISGI